VLRDRIAVFRTYCAALSWLAPSLLSRWRGRRRSRDDAQLKGAPRSGLAIRSEPAYLTSVLPDEDAMSAKQKLTTTVSTKGQVILPKAIRDQRHWSAGTELVVEDTPEGVLLKAKPVFAPTRPKDVFGSLPYKGPAKSIADMEAGIAAEAKRRHARNRY
jgi:AbrB family looped-hinge helix DNA binding protein